MADTLAALERLPQVSRSEAAGEQIFYLHLAQPTRAADRDALRDLRAALLDALPSPTGRISYDLNANGAVVGIWLDLR